MQNQLLGACSHLPQVRHRPGRTVPPRLRLSSTNDPHVSFRDRSLVSRYRRIERDLASGCSFFGFCVTELGCKEALEAIEERGLIGVDDSTRPGNFDELDFVHLPGRAAR